MEKEIRSISHEIRNIPESRKIEGYALLFNEESQDLGGFVEIISPNALDGVLERCDVLALYNHDSNRVLARNSYGTGTLSLEIDEKGLKYSFEVPDTTDGNDLFYHIQSGNIRNSSFAFTVDQEGFIWKRSDGKYIRIINKFSKIFDVSPVFFPAYKTTSVDIRSIENMFGNEERNVVDEPSVDLEITYNDNKYLVPEKLVKDIIDKTDQERELSKYFIELDESINEL